MAFRILCVDDDPAFLLATKAVLKLKHVVMGAMTYEEGLELLNKQEFDLLFLDVNIGSVNGIERLSELNSKYPYMDIIMLSGEKKTEYIVEAIQKGASDYLGKPCAADDLLAVVEKTLKNRGVKERYEALIEDVNEHSQKNIFVGESKALEGVLANAKRLKGIQAGVLIEGESGTGKELMARYLHSLENDSSRPFIAVNCAAIPENLLESELFGYEQGAFTGANKRKIGKFELACGGDIFLDEINSLKPDLQAKLLRVLQEKEFYRLGGVEPIQVNFRVVAAANVDLQKAVQEGSFRQDLLYRLRVISLVMPSLRDRVSDLEGLVAYFLNKHANNNKVKTVSNDVMAFFKGYHWPGNIRELENILQSLVIMSGTEEIQIHDLPGWLLEQNNNSITKDSLENLSDMNSCVSDEPLKDVMQRFEQSYIKKIIHLNGGNVSLAAKKLKISRSKVYYTLKDGEGCES